jgi:hypothetical protein
MRIRWTIWIATAAGLLTLVAGVAAGGGPARAAARPTAPAAVGTTTAVATTAGYVVGGQLNGVAATSAGNAWAVGATGPIGRPSTLLLHWNGKTWAKAAGVKPVAGSLTGIAAVSATNAWAVGYTGWPNPAKPERTLLMHWNGRSWLTVTTPKPVAGGFSAVSVAGGDAWAVGTAPLSAALIWHWNGKSWAKSTTPSVPGGVELLGVAQTSASTAWAGGEGALNGRNSDLLLRWNGRTWSRVPFPMQGVYHYLNAIAAGPKGTAWAVGQNAAASTSAALGMYWNGRAWAEPKESVPAGGNFNAVAAGGGTAWAVGTDFRNPATLTLIARWTGRAWLKVASPTPTGNATLTAVAAASATSAWAVGYTGLITPRTLILHWNGKVWR